MKIVRGSHCWSPIPDGCVVTIGNFDGVHRGHQAVLRQVASIGAARGLATVLMTFEPHPREFFSAAHAPPRLTRWREKMVALEGNHIDRVLMMRFDERLASMAPDVFAEQLLASTLGARCVVVGDDFRFGRRAEGGVELLRDVGARHGFDVERQDTYPVDGVRVSSSWIRDALANGELDTASRLLGRNYAICGRVVRGDQIGRQLGFPTANVRLGRVAVALSGVFAVRVHGSGLDGYPGMANVGTRPTVGGLRTLLEVNLLDFDGDLYGRELRVEFVDRLREERRFDGLDALKAQLGRDALAARTALGLATS